MNTERLPERLHSIPLDLHRARQSMCERSLRVVLEIVRDRKVARETIPLLLRFPKLLVHVHRTQRVLQNER